MLINVTMSRPGTSVPWVFGEDKRKIMMKQGMIKDKTKSD
jgi:hypothetical protein